MDCLHSFYINHVHNKRLIKRSELNPLDFYLSKTEITKENNQKILCYLGWEVWEGGGVHNLWGASFFLLIDSKLLWQGIKNVLLI